MENDLLKKLRENMKRLQKEGILSSREERSRLPLLSTTPEERRCAEVSRRPENVKMHMGQDLNLKMRSHQIVHTKTERLEADLKRAREQSYIKTMEISKLLTEKEELELKIEDLMNKNLQLAKEKEELCKEYEEKLSRKNSSDESGQLDKLRLENENLSFKVQKYSVEKAELLRENNDLIEELYRKTAVMSKLTLEKVELQMKTEMLAFKNIELSDEKEELCREYEVRLFREKQLRKGGCPLLMNTDQMDQRASGGECNTGSVSVCQTREDKTEDREKVKPQMVEYQLNKKWLKASVDSLKIKKSTESGQNILRWLQKSLKMLKEDSSKLSKCTLPEWLKTSTTHLQKECAEASREDVKGWLDVSLSHIQEGGPETCDLDVQEWFEASIIAIQHLQKSKSDSRKPKKGMV